jgi:hypothetical protein
VSHGHTYRPERSGQRKHTGADGRISFYPSSGEWYPEIPRVEMRMLTFCREKVWPSWAPGWIECGSMLRGGQCEKYGHRPTTPLPTDG